MDCRVKPGNDELYCTLSDTKRNSPSPLATSSSTDFLPSFFNWSTRFLMSAALPTASCATSTMTSPAESRFSAASELPSTPVMMTPLTLSLILYLLRKSLLRAARSRPSAFCVTGFSVGSSLVLAAACCTFSVSSRRPSLTFLVSSLPLRMTTTSTSLPTAVSATTRERSLGSLTSLPSNLTTTSPGSMPAGFAGPLSSTPAISAPRAGLMLRLSAISSVTCWMRTPGPAAAEPPELRERIDHGGDRLGGHGETKTDRAAGRRDDQCVDAHDLALEVEQRAAGIAAVDRGVGLDVAVVGPLADVAVAARDDAGRDRTAEAEGVADRDHPLAEPQLVGIAEFY